MRILEQNGSPCSKAGRHARVESRLGKGKVRIAVRPPTHRLRTMMVRAPLPAGWRVTGARLGDKVLRVDRDGAVDVTGQERAFELRLKVERRR